MAQRDHPSRQQQAGGYTDDTGYDYDPHRDRQQHGASSGGQRSDAGSNYGDFRHGGGQHEQRSDRGRGPGDYYSDGNRGQRMQGRPEGDSLYQGYGGQTGRYGVQQGGRGMSDFPAPHDDRGPGPGVGDGRQGGREPERQQPDWGHRPGAMQGGAQASTQGQQEHNQFDPDYHQWRAEQLRNLDNDYKQWREERYKKFSEEFDTWRKGRNLQGSGTTGGAADPDAGTATPGSELPGAGASSTGGLR